MKKILFMLALAAIALISFQSCSKSENEGGDEPVAYNPENDGIQGHWISEGDNVAPVFVTYYNIAKVTATFNANGTFSVETTKKDESVSALTGTYVQTKSSVDGIWDIVLNQTTPTALTGMGIFQITKDEEGGYTMKYEVAQTEPEVGAVPPTAEAGFGSTNGGAFGQMNVQVYIRTGDL